MCARVECPTCGKPTYAGCGAHIEQVLGDVPKPERCQCRESPKAPKVPKAPATGHEVGWFRKLLGQK